MRAGWLRHRVTLKTKSVSRDSFGEEDITWSTTATVWGSVEPLRGREYMEAQQGQADVSHRVTIRYRTGVVPTMRVYLEDGRAFEVESAINRLERDEQIELMCRELVSA